MHTLRNRPPRVTPKQRKVRKEEQVEEFFDEVDSGKYGLFVQEESFQEFLDAVRRKSAFIQNYLKIDSDDKLEFSLFCPKGHFCAMLSQFTFDRNCDVTFRYCFIKYIPS